MIEYFKLALSRYTEFTGRSRRSEYWYFVLGTTLISWAIQLVFGLLLDSPILLSVLSLVVSLAFFVPQIAVAARRLHDIGRSGWWQLIVFTIIGIFVLLYWLVQDSEPGANKYGPNPKTGATDDGVMRHLVE